MTEVQSLRHFVNRFTARLHVGEHTWELHIFPHMYLLIWLATLATKTATAWMRASGGSKGGEGLGLCPHPPTPNLLDLFFLQQRSVTNKKRVLNENEICHKMLEMAILDTQIFKNFLGEHAPRKLAPSIIWGSKCGETYSDQVKSLLHFVNRSATSVDTRVYQGDVTRRIYSEERQELQVFRD